MLLNQKYAKKRKRGSIPVNNKDYSQGWTSERLLQSLEDIQQSGTDLIKGMEVLELQLANDIDMGLITKDDMVNLFLNDITVRTISFDTFWIFHKAKLIEFSCYLEYILKDESVVSQVICQIRQEFTSNKDENVDDQILPNLICDIIKYCFSNGFYTPDNNSHISVKFLTYLMTYQCMDSLQHPPDESNTINIQKLHYIKIYKQIDIHMIRDIFIIIENSFYSINSNSVQKFFSNIISELMKYGIYEKSPIDGQYDILDEDFMLILSCSTGEAYCTIIDQVIKSSDCQESINLMDYQDTVCILSSLNQSNTATINTYDTFLNQFVDVVVLHYLLIDRKCLTIENLSSTDYPFSNTIYLLSTLFKSSSNNIETFNLNILFTQIIRIAIKCIEQQSNSVIIRRIITFIDHIAISIEKYSFILIHCKYIPLNETLQTYRHPMHRWIESIIEYILTTSNNERLTYIDDNLTNILSFNRAHGQQKPITIPSLSNSQVIEYQFFVTTIAECLEYLSINTLKTIQIIFKQYRLLNKDLNDHIVYDCMKRISSIPSQIYLQSSFPSIDNNHPYQDKSKSSIIPSIVTNNQSMKENIPPLYPKERIETWLENFKKTKTINIGLKLACCQNYHSVLKSLESYIESSNTSDSYHIVNISIDIVLQMIKDHLCPENVGQKFIHDQTIQTSKTQDIHRIIENLRKHLNLPDYILTALVNPDLSELSNPSNNTPYSSGIEGIVVWFTNIKSIVEKGHILNKSLHKQHHQRLLDMFNDIRNRLIFTRSLTKIQPPGNDPSQSTGRQIDSILSSIDIIIWKLYLHLCQRISAIFINYSDIVDETIKLNHSKINDLSIIFLSDWTSFLRGIISSLDTIITGSNNNHLNLSMKQSNGLLDLLHSEIFKSISPSMNESGRVLAIAVVWLTLKEQGQESMVNRLINKLQQLACDEIASTSPQTIIEALLRCYYTLRTYHCLSWKLMRSQSSECHVNDNNRIVKGFIESNISTILSYAWLDHIVNQLNLKSNYCSILGEIYQFFDLPYEGSSNQCKSKPSAIDHMVPLNPSMAVFRDLCANLSKQYVSWNTIYIRIHMNLQMNDSISNGIMSSCEVMTLWLLTIKLIETFSQRGS